MDTQQLDGEKRRREVRRLSDIIPTLSNRCSRMGTRWGRMEKDWIT